MVITTILILLLEDSPEVPHLEAAIFLTRSVGGHPNLTPAEDYGVAYGRHVGLQLISPIEGLLHKCLNE